MSRLLLGLLGWCWALVASAHPMPETRVWVDARPQGAVLTLEIPLDRLEFAFGQPLAAAPQEVLARHSEALSRYLLLHVGARGERAGWQVLRPTLAIRSADTAPELEARLELRAPPGEDPRRFTLLLDAVTHEVKTHRVQVLLRSDWAGGVAAGLPTPLGTLDAQHRSLPVNLGDTRSGGAFLPLVAHGALHIAEGTDHLVFLALLLLVAPLAAQGRRWHGVRGPTGTLRQVVWLATAFTLGHSVTLALGSSGLVTPPSGPVEMAVALTIVVAAVHAWRPLWAGGERAMALLFGLVHGLAFSASLNGAGLAPLNHALALLAFNLGIEAAQLAVVLLTVPALSGLARQAPGVYTVLRNASACAAALLGASWLADRAGLALPFATELLEPGPWAPAVAIGLLWATWALGVATLLKRKPR